MSDPQATFTASGTPASSGTCPVCGTRLYRMGRTPAHEGLEPSQTSVPRSRKSVGSRRRNGRLVIVESPAKARTVRRFLGRDYVVRASIGHVRDLLRSQLSVDVENNFEPKYRVPNDKRPVVKDLKADAAKAAEVFLATDPDREGEAIAWHLLHAVEIPSEMVRRVVFHEITAPAIEEAFRHPRSIDMDLVNAQQARRILDRLVGYSLSPLLWEKVRGRLSAGRVQSVALRLVVEREKEIRAFQSREYWTIDGEFLQPVKPPAFRARLVQLDGKEPELASESELSPILSALRNGVYTVAGVKRGSRVRRPSPPFITSTLQQDASRRLGFTARRTMAIAQQLYEGVELGKGEPMGLITYMRTDSPQVSPLAQEEARQLIRERFGEAFLPEQAPTYRARARGAQEAHEAIRPTSVARAPELIKSSLTPEQLKLYTLVWKRFVASQMTPAEYDTLTIEVDGKHEVSASSWRVSASSLRFAGFLAAYEDKPDADEPAEAEGEQPEARLAQLPDLAPGDALNLLDLYPERHFTQPPPRYSEATLVRSLEENGIGRPSTYAPILTTLQQRGYVLREKRKLISTEIGETVNDLLVDHFPDIVDLGFTARMEEGLDDIAGGKRPWVDLVRSFYGPFSEQVDRALENMPEMKAEPEILDRLCPETGHPLLVRYGRFGKFIGCTGFPECRYTEPWLEKIGVRCPEDGGELVERRTRKGRMFYGCANYPNCSFSTWKRPLIVPCPNCSGLLVQANRQEASCIRCESRFDLKQLSQPEAETA